MPSTRPASLRSTSKPLCDSSTTTSAPLRRAAANGSPQAVLANAERPFGDHPARIGDGRIGKGLPDHGDADAALLEHARGVKHRLVEVGVADVAGQKRYARRARLIDACRTARSRARAPSVNSQCPVVASMPSACITAIMSAPLDCKRRVGALQRVAAVEQQHALGAALGPDRLDQRRHAIHAADPAIGPAPAPRSRPRSACRRSSEAGRNAERRQELLSDEVRQLTSRLADAEIERGLAKVERLELRMAVGHVQKGELALRREAQKVVLPDRALSCGAAQPASPAR